MNEGKPAYKFHETDNGNCRVYYRGPQALRCFQEDTRGIFTFYVCSRDGEPSFPASEEKIELDRVPNDDSPTAVAFRAWWQARQSLTKS